jgi:hypothetical protein
MRLSGIILSSETREKITAILLLLERELWNVDRTNANN